MIEVSNLRKSYHGQEAVRGISFSIKSGQFFALLGPNGAGKSTTINILCTSIQPDSGTVIIDGWKVGNQNWEIRKRIGVVFQNGVLDELLTVEENLYTRGRFYGLRGYTLKQRIREITELTGISDLLGRLYGQLSGGQKRRCDIARALLHMPKILLLDEPTTGLDPKMRSALWEMIHAIQKKTGMTLLLTTHYMEETAKADSILIMKEGEIALEGPPEVLKEQFSKDSLCLFSLRSGPLKEILNRKGIMYCPKNGGVEISLSSTLEALPILQECRGWYSDFEVQRGTMDEAYLSVIERGRIDD